jgi:hypothetical protein
MIVLHEQTDCPRTLDRSFPTQTVYEGRGPEESGDDDGLHSHYELMGGQLGSKVPHTYFFTISLLIQFCVPNVETLVLISSPVSFIQRGRIFQLSSWKILTRVGAL